MEKKDKKESSKKKGKMAALKNLRKAMMDEMGGEGMKKVSVMAKDKKGLKKGLDKAKEILGGESEDSEEMC